MVCHVFVFVSISVFLPRGCSCFFFIVWPRGCLFLSFLYSYHAVVLVSFLYSHHAFVFVSFFIFNHPFIVVSFSVFLPHVCPCLFLIFLPRVDRCHLKNNFDHFNFHIVFFVRFWYIFPIIDWHWTLQIERYKPSRRYFNNMSDAP